MIRLVFPLVLAGCVWLISKRQFEQSIVVVGGLAVGMTAEIGFESLLHWVSKRNTRFAVLGTDILALFTAVPDANSAVTPKIHEHQGGN
jgi:hypothetical protein